MDDFKPPVRNDTPNGDPVDAGPVSYEDSETYVTPEGKPTPVTPTAAPLEISKKKSGAKKWLLTGIVVLLLAGLGALAYWQYAEAENARKEAESLRATLTTVQDASKTDTDKEAVAEPASKTEDFAEFQRQYILIQEAAVSYSDTDKTAIEKGIKDYYKMTTMPSDWAILAVYKDAKADEATGKPLNALIYWPAGEKPAGFFEMNQAANGSWTYNELR